MIHAWVHRSFLLALAAATTPLAADEILFGRDIRPLLSDRCFACHGPDAESRQAKLHLSTFEDATARRKRGRFAIVPGDLEKSLLWHRITATDPLDQMPPPDSGKPALTEAEQDLIRRWIESGAVYDTHWSFAPLIQPPLPPVTDPQWPRTALDHFILSRLEAADVPPANEADAATRCRRLYFDLTGLPPTLEEQDAFLADSSPKAWEHLVDKLLTEEPYTTRFAEHMATPWLDLARYADTCGIHQDNGRSIWPWRDWVLEAFRTNMPLDQFITAQLAGDLMEDATSDQLIASGFNRNHVTSDEGGAIDDEYLFEYAVDRTNTFGTTFLGLTINCAQCHDHRFDPVTAKDYYSLLAFFNSNEEPGIYSQTQDATRAYEPFIEILSPEEQHRIATLTKEILALTADRAQATPEETADLAAFSKATADDWAWTQPAISATSSQPGVAFETLSDGSLLATGPATDSDDIAITLRTDRQDLRAVLVEVLMHESLPQGGPGRASNGNMVLTSIDGVAVSTADPTQTQAIEFSWAWADIEQQNGDYATVNAINGEDGRGWAISANEDRDDRVAMFLTDKPFGFEGGTALTITLRFHSIYQQHSAGRIALHLGSSSDEAIANLPVAHSNWYIVGPFATDSGAEAYDTVFGPEVRGPIDFDASYQSDSWRHAPGVVEGENVTLAQGVGAEYVGRQLCSPSSRHMELSMGSDDGLQVYLNGRLVHEARVDRGVAADQEHVEFDLPAGKSTLVCKFINTGGNGAMYHKEIIPENQLYGDAVAMTLPIDVPTDALAHRATDAWRLRFSPRYAKLTTSITTRNDEAEHIREAAPSTMVMKDQETPRETFVMTRGLYDGQDKDRPVSRNIPAVLGDIGIENPTRLDLAAWVVGDKNPVTARVLANRLWYQFFGRGFSSTIENVGLQGEWPSHPDLLNWMAADLRSDWDLKRAIRGIVLSATYQQDVALPNIDKRLIAGFPRQRLSAEQIRDQALHVSGLLVETLGGPSVKPYQPDGLWKEVAMLTSNTKAFEQGEDGDLWRRSIYTYWKRASPPPSLLTFDAPTREFCVARRTTTDTPLQTLVLWNDLQFVEAARETAGRVLQTPGSTDERIHMLYRLCTGDTPTADMTRRLSVALRDWIVRYGAAPDDAAALVSLGESPAAESLPKNELAAWTMLASAVLSSDAAIVKD
jgi:hypothetical protein